MLTHEQIRDLNHMRSWAHPDHAKVLDAAMKDLAGYYVDQMPASDIKLLFGKPIDPRVELIEGLDVLMKTYRPDTDTVPVGKSFLERIKKALQDAK